MQYHSAQLTLHDTLALLLRTLLFLPRQTKIFSFVIHHKAVNTTNYLVTAANYSRITVNYLVTAMKQTGNSSTGPTLALFCHLCTLLHILFPSRIMKITDLYNVISALAIRLAIQPPCSTEDVTTPSCLAEEVALPPCSAEDVAPLLRFAPVEASAGR